MCKPVHANLHFGLSPSPSSPNTEQGCFPLGFSSPDDFTRAHREACSEVNKRSSENPFMGSSKVPGSQSVQPSLPLWGQGASVKPRSLADGPTPGDQATSRPEEQECTKKDTVATGGRRSQPVYPARGKGAQRRVVPRRHTVVKYSGGCFVSESGDGPG